MRKKWLIILISVGLVLFGSLSASAVPLLQEWASNVDGVVGQAGDASLLDGAYGATGLGSISFTVTGAGDHFVGLFVDHEFSEPVNTFFNEYGLDNGGLAAGQSWEVDEPGYVFGDIYDNFSLSDAGASALANDSSLDSDFVDDVSMALGWNFFLDADDTAQITFLVSEQLSADMADAFYLTHFDPDSNERLFFGSTLAITGGSGGVAPVPEPATIVLLGSGLMGIAAFGRKRLVKK